jgi:uncharacterized membrane protein YbhN (UPF0104 family)
VEALKAFLKLLPLLVGLVILVAIATLSPWREVEALLRRVSWAEWLLMGALALSFFATKALRYWAMLRMLKFEVPLSRASMAYVAAQPVSIIPGGEVYRGALLERYAGISLKESAPTLTMQGLVESAVTLAVAFAGTLWIGQNRVLVLIATLIVLVIMVALRRGWLKDKEGAVNKLPFVSVSRKYYNRFVLAHRRLMRPDFLWTLVGLSALAVGIGIAIMDVAAAAIDAPLSWAQAAIAFSLPVVLGSVTLLPGGLGANEGTSIGILKLMGVATGAAVTMTLLLRLFTLGAGVTLGLLTLGLTYIRKPENDQ